MIVQCWLPSCRHIPCIDRLTDHSFARPSVHSFVGGRGRRNFLMYLSAWHVYSCTHFWVWLRLLVEHFHWFGAHCVLCVRSSTISRHLANTSSIHLIICMIDVPRKSFEREIITWITFSTAQHSKIENETSQIWIPQTRERETNMDSNNST